MATEFHRKNDTENKVRNQTQNKTLEIHWKTGVEIGVEKMLDGVEIGVEKIRHMFPKFLTHFVVHFCETVFT
jgi:hypothetical protein